MDISLQTRLLHVLETGQFMKIGSTYSNTCRCPSYSTEDLVKEVLKCKNDKEAEQVGIEWCVAQCKELMAHGVPSIHFYSIGAVDSIKEVAKIIY